MSLFERLFGKPKTEAEIFKDTWQGQRVDCLTVQRLTLKPGDIIVVSVPGPISDKTAMRIREAFELKVKGHSIIVKQDDMKIGVMGP